MSVLLPKKGRFFRQEPGRDPIKPGALANLAPAGGLKPDALRAGLRVKSENREAGVVTPGQYRLLQ
jgi:hypothetical protein